MWWRSQKRRASLFQKIKSLDYIGVSIKTISRIRKEDLSSRKSISLGKKRPRKENKKFHSFSDETKIIIKNLIYNFYIYI